MQELLRCCLLAAGLMMVLSLSGQENEKEAFSTNRFTKTLSGKNIVTFSTNDIVALSKYIQHHNDVQLLEYANGAVTLISDNPTRLSTISNIFNLTQKPKTNFLSKFTSHLQKAFKEAKSNKHFDFVVTVFQESDVPIISDQILKLSDVSITSVLGKSLILSGPKIQLKKIAELAEISSIDLKDEEVRPLNYESRIVQRNSLLHGNTNIGGYGLTGSGITIGIGDGGELGEHLDFGDRVINQANGTYSAFGAHGDHVVGIVGSSGTLNPRHKGVAPKAQLVTQKTTQIIANAEDYAEAYDMSLTNNSYGVSFNCGSNGTYNYNSVNLDYMSRMNPKLLHVFAAGNNGLRSCEGFPSGYNTILRNYQSSKNVLTVGATNDQRNVADISARGPVADGRIKPEIVASGMNIISTGNNFNYFSNNGTSMAAPALTGTLALLSEQYKKMYNELPDAALLKAIVCNTADDIGNPGPDYAAGFGLVNGRRAIEAIIEGRHAQGTVTNGNNNTHEIQVPSGLAEIKVMLYWHDREGAAYAETTLVNDLDLIVTDQNQDRHFPWILNTDPSAVNQNASKGIDELNNIEQVSINNPTSGNLSIIVDGSKSVFPTQDYVLVYEFVYPEVTLTHPLGGEIFTPSTYELISWDAEPGNTSMFEAAFSSDNGHSWNIISNAIPANQRSLAWNIPTDATENAMIRIRKVTENHTHHSKSFKIRQNLTNLKVEPVCEGMVSFGWQYAGDENYNTSILQIKNEGSIELDIANNNGYLLDQALNAGEEYWFALNFADNNQQLSSRSVAQKVTPVYDITCPWGNDLKLSAAPVSFTGRANSSKSTITAQIPVDIKNIGADPQENTSIKYNLGGTQEYIIPGTLVSGETHTFNLISTVRDLDPGVYPVDIYADLINDPTENHYLNDILTIKMLTNDVINIPFDLDISQATLATYAQNKVGILGLDRLDFDKGNSGKLSVLGNDNEKIISLVVQDMDEESSMTFIFNLNGRPVDQPLILNLGYLKPENGTSSILVRGDDQNEFIKIEEFNNSNEWTDLQNVDIAAILESKGQQFSSSTQIRIVQSDVGAISINYLKLDGEETNQITPYENTLTSFIESDLSFLVWNNNKESENVSFEIQYAMDSLALVQGYYEVLNTVSGQGTSQSGWTYEQVIKDLQSGSYYFRIASTDANGIIHVSNIIKLTITDQDLIKEQITAQVQSLVDSDLHYTLSVTERTRIGVRLIDASGSTVFNSSDTYDAGTHELLIQHAEFQNQGMYFMEISSAKDRLVSKVVKQ